MPSRLRWSGVCFGFLLSFSAIDSVSAENPVDGWLTERLAARRAAVAEASEERATETQVALGTRSTANQLETPAASTNATSLADSSSAADLASIALNLAGLSGSSQDGDEEQDVTSASATLSAYALWSAWDGRDPLGPAYCDPSARIARSFSGTLGFDDETNGPDNRAVLYGGKFELAPFLWALIEEEPGAAAGKGQGWIEAWRAGDPCDQASWERVQSKVEAAATSMAEYRAFLRDEVDKKGRRLGEFQSKDELAKFLTEQGIDVRFADEFDSVSYEQSAMQALDAAVETEVRRYDERPRLSFQVLARDQEVGKDMVEAKAILDTTWQRLRLTGNGAYAKKGSDDGGNASIEMEWNPSREVRLQGRGPLRLALAGRGEWMEDNAPIYKGQLKVTFPLWDGLEVPVSFTVANRTGLVDETEMRGLVGFSVDTTRLLAWLGRADGGSRP